MDGGFGVNKCNSNDIGSACWSVPCGTCSSMSPLTCDWTTISTLSTCVHGGTSNIRENHKKKLVVCKQTRTQISAISRTWRQSRRNRSHELIATLKRRKETSAVPGLPSYTVRSELQLALKRVTWVQGSNVEVRKTEKKGEHVGRIEGSTDLHAWCEYPFKSVQSGHRWRPNCIEIFAQYTASLKLRGKILGCCRLF
jgi:hypothetical protein